MLKPHFGIAMLFWAVALTGCSLGSNDVDSHSGCIDAETGERIALRDSGLTCSEAFAIYVLLPAGDRKRTQRVEGDGSVWLCRGSSRDGSEIRYICKMGKREFAVLTEP